VQTINTVQKYMYGENYKHHVQLLIMMIYRVCILNPTIYFLIKKKNLIAHTLSDKSTELFCNETLYQNIMSNKSGKNSTNVYVLVIPCTYKVAKKYGYS
jgi:hypothetical protein